MSLFSECEYLTFCFPDATVFPDNLNLMVLDGNVDTDVDIISRTVDDVRSNSDRLDYFIASCEFGNEHCGTTDVRTCINGKAVYAICFLFEPNITNSTCNYISSIDLNRMVDKIGNEYESWIAPFKSLLELFGISASK